MKTEMNATTTVTKIQAKCEYFCNTCRICVDQLICISDDIKRLHGTTK